MIEAINISLNTGGKTLLGGINFSAAEGEFVCVAGANGSGKTLLLKILSGLLKPSSGKVLLNGKDIFAYQAARRSAALRFIGAECSSAFNFKAEDIAVMGTNPLLKWWQDYKAEHYAAARKAMRQTDTEALADREIFTLSSGELQRVFIAQALSCGPGVIIADEPTSHLDLKQKHEVFKIFSAQAAAGRTVICASHDMELIRRYGTKLYLLKNGSVFARGAALPESAVNAAYGIE